MNGRGARSSGSVGRALARLVTGGVAATGAVVVCAAPVVAAPAGNGEITYTVEASEKPSFDVRVIGPDNLVSDMAADASQLYAKNLENLLGLLVGEDGEAKVDFDDDILDAACIVHAGEIRGERTAQ